MYVRDAIRDALTRDGTLRSGEDDDLRFARWVGSVEGTMDTTLQGAFLDWVRDNLPDASRDDSDALHDAVTAAEADGTSVHTFANALVDHVLGRNARVDPFPGTGRDGRSGTGHVRAVPGLGSGVPPLTAEAEAFAHAAGRTLFDEAWRYRRNLRDEAGWRTVDVLPSTPPEAVLVGAELCGRYEAASGMEIGAFHRATLRKHFGEDDVTRYLGTPEHGLARFASDLAWESAGIDHLWVQRHPATSMPEVYLSYEGEAGLPECPPDTDDADAPAPSL